MANLEYKPLIIFTTTHKKFAHEGFELEALDYLLKPISPERFVRVVNKAVEQFKLKKENRTNITDSLIVRSEYKMVRIELVDI